MRNFDLVFPKKAWQCLTRHATRRSAGIVNEQRTRHLCCYKFDEPDEACTVAVGRLHHLVLATNTVTGFDKGAGRLGWLSVSKSLRRRFLDETPLGTRFLVARNLGCCDRHSANTR